MAIPIIKKQARPAAEGIDEEVQIAIAIDISKSSARTVLAFHEDTGTGSYVFKAPVAEVAIEGAMGSHAAEKKIAPAIAIHISRGNPRAAGAQRILKVPFIRDVVGESNASGRCVQPLQIGFSSGRNGHF